MPGKDGGEVCQEARHCRDEAYTYLILLSSKESKQEIVQGPESGADEYLTKPYDSEELKARLRAGERILRLEDHLVEARESVRFQGTHDLFPSLWNRGVIVELLSREIHRSRRENNCTAVMLCDIDHFKLVNDQHGHSAGDDVLREVAQRLQRSVRSYDMVGHYGGEEFLVILNKCDAAGAAVRAENLRTVIPAKPLRTRAASLSLRISIGVALSTDFAGRGLDEIIQESDRPSTRQKQRDAIAYVLRVPPRSRKFPRFPGVSPRVWQRSDRIISEGDSGRSSLGLCADLFHHLPHRHG